MTLTQVPQPKLMMLVAAKWREFQTKQRSRDQGDQIGQKFDIGEIFHTDFKKRPKF
jgi:hypothetical protein